MADTVTGTVGLWKRFTRLCQEKGFTGAGWQTHGVKPVDQRETTFANVDRGNRKNFKRPLPMTTYSFLELTFTIDGDLEKNAADYRQAAREIRQELRDTLCKQLIQRGQ